MSAATATATPPPTLAHVIAAPAANQTLHDHAAQNGDDIESLLDTHGAVLFRGFTQTGIPDFSQICEVVGRGTLIPAPDESTPRVSLGGQVFESTHYPAHQAIALHNEGGYCARWPHRLIFGCIEASATGGQTPLADVRKVRASLDEADIAPLLEHGVRYIRVYREGLGLSWQQTFWTEDRAEVEAFCRDNGMTWTWEGDDLRTEANRPAVRPHPKTGETVWFNHMAFFHAANLDPAIREALEEEFGPDGLPYQVRLGNGESIPDDVARRIAAAYEQHSTAFTWRDGDVLLIDNLRVCHGRLPYTGSRKVIVALVTLET